MFEDLLQQVAELKSQDQPFVLATVVACKPPTSAKPGAKAIVQADGSFTGWVGGSCAQPLVTQESLKALQDGQSRLVLLAPHPEELDLGLEGTVLIPMTCQSEGTLAIYLEPFLPRPQLLVIGQSPMARSLASLGNSLGFYVSVCDPDATRELFPDAQVLLQDLSALKDNVRPRSYAIVATMGHYDEEALEAVLQQPVSYVGLVASPRRGQAVVAYLRSKGVPDEALQMVKFPAGLDIGAETPEEIALSILAEIVQRRQSEEKSPPSPRYQREDLEVRTEAAVSSTGEQEVALDPICSMSVAIADSRYSSRYDGQPYYFCCLRCKETFDRNPAAALRNRQAR